MAQVIGSTEAFHRLEEANTVGFYKGMAPFPSFPDEADEFLFNEDGLREDTTEQYTELSDLERSLADAVRRDDGAQLVSLANQTRQEDRDNGDQEPLDPGWTARLLQLACRLDSAECARALMEGETGTLVRVNEMDGCGWTPLHTAAGAHSAKCVELLLSKNARTDVKSKDGKSLRALETALFSTKMQIEWSPKEPAEELIALLCEMDLSVVRMLAEKTRDVAEISYACAVGGLAVALAALLMVAADKVVSPINVRGLCGWGARRSTTVYESVLEEALALGVLMKTAGSGRSPNKWGSAEDCHDRRELLLREIELLQLFGAVSVSKDKKVMPPLLQAAQVGDEAIVKLLLKVDVHVNETDADGNSSLHWCLKAGPSAQGRRILWLLLKHGAVASQRNRLGLTPFHIAAEKGNYQALKILLLHSPESIDIASETKETPLFFAVKNNLIECVQLLLQHGANSQALNIRRQRPIDTAKSLDMRFLLSSISKGFWSGIRPIQETGLVHPSEEDLYQEIFEQSPGMNDEHPYTESALNSSKPNAKVETCRYYGSPTGCVRGAQCYYAHGEDKMGEATSGPPEGRQSASRFETGYLLHSKDDLHTKVFVGGLPPSVDSDCLKEFFKAKFGPVEEAVVIGVQEGNEVHSRGFGFVTFEQEEAAASAIKAHFVSIRGKSVEIKTVVRKCTSLAGDSRTNSRDKLEGKSDDPAVVGPLSEQNPPPWLSKFKEWLPVFLKEATKRLAVGEWYPLSSLKGDFRATCGMELDHTNLGFLKLSDFMRSLPGLCKMRVVRVRGGSASHAVLLPQVQTPRDNQLPPASTPSPQQDLLPVEEGVAPSNSKDDQPSATPSGSPLKQVERSQSSPTSELAADLSRILKSLLSEKDYFGAANYGGSGSNPAGRDVFLPAFGNPTRTRMGGLHGEYPVGRAVGGGGGTGGWMQPPQEPSNREGGNGRSFSFFERQWDHFLIERGSCIICKDRRGSWAMIPCLHKVCGRCKENQTPRYCMICGAVVHGFRPWLQAGVDSQNLTN